MKSLSFILFLFFIIPALSIAQTDCDKLLKKTISSNAILPENLEATVNGLQELKHCGIDSTILQVFVTPELFPTLLLGILEKKDSITYKRIFDFLVELQAEGVSPFKLATMQANQRLKKKKVDLSTWELDRQDLLLMQIDSADIARFYSYLQAEKLEELTYFEAWQLLYPVQKPPTKPKSPTKIQLAFWEIHNDVPFHSILQKSAHEQKPVLLYFSGWNDVDSRKLEVALFKEEIRQQLEARYIIYTLLTDDRTPLTDSDHNLDPSFSKGAKNLGAKNRNLKNHYMPSSEIPCFVIVDSEGNRLKALDAAITRDNFYDFLGIEQE